ncbi:tail fiber assembly protein [Serratia grimesii]|jgi:hypothetical protein|uniref:tail fiber assembly protein n=2 Tax=Serratia grimesii TaxID=82995 RepID=UPI0009ED7F8D|nr:tail fiber assembly protein [Serratia grimesii]
MALFFCQHREVVTYGMHCASHQFVCTLGIITDADKASLVAWMEYVQKVQAIDTQLADKIVWPNPPNQSKGPR